MSELDDTTMRNLRLIAVSNNGNISILARAIMKLAEPTERNEER